MKPWFKMKIFRWLIFSILTLLNTSVLADSVQLKLETGQNSLLADSPQKLFIKVGLTGIAPPETQRRAPLNVAIVIDRSGSMSGDKIRNARKAALTALNYLKSNDTIAIVTYDDKINVPVPATKFRNKTSIQYAIRGIRTGGYTALYAGVVEGANQIKHFLNRERVNRIVLISDGLANVGPDSPEELGGLGIKLAKQRISVSTIGLGLGYNEDLMVRLADVSDGNHVFVEDSEQLAGIFRKEFGELGTAVAQTATIRIQCQDGVKPLRILGRDGRINGNSVEVEIQQLYAKQERYLLLEVELTPGAADSERKIAAVNLDYDDLITNTRTNANGIIKISYTTTPKIVEKSVNREVMIDATTQIGVKMDEEAVAHKDKGDTQKARAVFRRKAQMFRARAAKYKSKTLRKQATFAEEAADEVVAARTSSWKGSRTRKIIFNTKNYYKKQQSYGNSNVNIKGNTQIRRNKINIPTN